MPSSLAAITPIGISAVDIACPPAKVSTPVSGLPLVAAGAQVQLVVPSAVGLSVSPVSASVESIGLVPSSAVGEVKVMSSA